MDKWYDIEFESAGAGFSPANVEWKTGGDGFHFIHTVRWNGTNEFSGCVIESRKGLIDRKRRRIGSHASDTECGRAAHGNLPAPPAAR